MSGLVLAPSFVLGSSLVVSAAQLATMLVVGLAAGVRLRFWRTFTFFAVVVLFNLATPAGRVVLTVATLPVTSGALMLGLDRATTLTSLLMLSKLAIRSRLRLPGRLGALITLTLGYLRHLLALPVAEMVKQPSRRLDELLVRLYRDHTAAEPRASQEATPAGRTTPVIAAVSGLIIVASWVAALLV